MTVKITKPALNLREELNSLKQPAGLSALLEKIGAVSNRIQVSSDMTVAGTATFTDSIEMAYSGGLNTFNLLSNNTGSGTLNILSNAQAAGTDKYINIGKNTGSASGTATFITMGDDSDDSLVTVVGDFKTTGQVTVTGGALSAPSYSFIGDTDTGISHPTTNAVNIVTGGQERVRVDSSGHVGIKTTPSAWGTGYAVLDLNTGGSIYGTTTGVSTASNLYFTGSSWLAKNTGLGTLYAQHTGKHVWYSSASVSAGSAAGLSQKMELTAGGDLLVDRLGIATTAPNAPLTVWTASSASSQSALRLNNAGGFSAAGSGCEIIFSQDRNTSEDLRMAAISSMQVSTGSSAHGALRFWTRASSSITEKVRIQHNGIISASAGITLGDGLNYTAANTLDDYEEGTWTPSFSGAGSPSYSTQFGRYTKVGRIVYCTIAIRATSVSGSSHIEIAGLPFTPSDTGDTTQRPTYSPFLGGHCSGLSESTGRFRTLTNTNLAGIKGSTSTTFMTAAEFSSGGSPQITGDFWYYTS